METDKPYLVDDLAHAESAPEIHTESGSRRGIESCEQMSKDRDFHLSDLEAELVKLRKSETSFLKTLSASLNFVAPLVPPSMTGSHAVSALPTGGDGLRQRLLTQLRSAGEIHHVLQSTLSFLRIGLEFQGAPTIINKTAIQREVHLQQIQNYLTSYSTVNKAELDKVEAAMANAEWDFRTAKSLAKETGINEGKLDSLLDDNPELFRKLPLCDKSGNGLYALASRPISLRERIAVLQTALKGRNRSAV